MDTEPKPLPVACDNCGQAIEHDKKLCIHCASKAGVQRSGDPWPEVDYRKPNLSSIAAGLLSSDMAYMVGLMASQRIRRRDRQSSVPRNHE